MARLDDGSGAREKAITMKKCSDTLTAVKHSREMCRRAESRA